MQFRFNDRLYFFSWILSDNIRLIYSDISNTYQKDKSVYALMTFTGKFTFKFLITARRVRCYLAQLYDAKVKAVSYPLISFVPGRRICCWICIEIKNTVCKNMFRNHIQIIKK